MTKDKTAPVDMTMCTINGEEYKLRITLGGLAALERKFGVKSITQLGERLSNDPSINDVLEMALVALRCGGEDVPDDFFMTAEVDLGDLSRAIGAAIAHSFASQGRKVKPGNVKAA